MVWGCLGLRSTAQAFAVLGCPGLGTVTRARIHDPNLFGVGLSRAMFYDPSLSGVRLSRARIHDPSLSGAGLSRARNRDQG